MNKFQGSGFRTVRGYQLENRQKGGLTSSLEDYLEMVYRLCLKDNYARVGKLSELLHVKPSSTSKMIFKLVDLGYLRYDCNDSILLTDKGKEKGSYLLYRHDILEQFLTMIGNTSPLEEAELIEHSLSSTTTADIKILTDFFNQNPDIKNRYMMFKKKNAENIHFSG